MIHSFYYFIVFLYLINYYYFIKLVFHNIFFISLPKLEPNSSASWKRSLLKMHEMFDKCLMYSLMAVMACVSDWRMVPRLCSRLHIKDTVTSLRNCSSSPPHLAFWRYERHACVSFLHLVFKPMPLPCIWTVCVLLCKSRTVLQLFMPPSWAGIPKQLHCCWRQMPIQLYPTRSVSDVWI